MAERAPEPPPSRPAAAATPAGRPAASTDLAPRTLTPSSIIPANITGVTQTRDTDRKTALFDRPRLRRAPVSSDDLEAQELWFKLTRRDWLTLVVIPADPRGTALPIARALVEAGTLVGGNPVEFISAE